MILGAIFLLLLPLLNGLVSLLPEVNQTILNAEYDLINSIIPAIQSIGYYYFPLDTLFAYLNIYINVLISVFVVKALFNFIVPMFTAGFVKTDKA